ncbi:hypothetical protein Moror_10300 [Moniliophthora roreri MCA 2997]|uniref:DUF6533 domain-containing protein n=1 Tax=Moniliophthora roreri (strain MCA 2997) TaxID=1381753 RepID=V2XGQ3_MONRO|nr:hypothetical protein Moror_10300 [Moniliophthora roreri MCA 2997]
MDWNSQQVEHHFRDHHVQRLVQVFAVSILFWDHIITLDSEIRHIWTRPKSRSSVLFLTFRYFTLANNLSVVVFLSFDSWTVEVILFISQAAVCTLLTLRLYALYSADKRVLLLYVITATMGCGMAGFALSGQESTRFPIQFGCHNGTSRQSSIRLAGIWMVLFAYDTVIFFLTAYRTYRYWRYETVIRHSESLLSLMFRDGALYFAVMALANLANILTFCLCGPFMSGGLSAFASCISATMLCRLMLNLHATADVLSTRRTDLMQTWGITTVPAVVED